MIELTPLRPQTYLFKITLKFYWNFERLVIMFYYDTAHFFIKSGVEISFFSEKSDFFSLFFWIKYTGCNCEVSNKTEKLVYKLKMQKSGFLK